MMLAGAGAAGWCCSSLGLWVAPVALLLLRPLLLIEGPHEKSHVSPRLLPLMTCFGIVGIHPCRHCHCRR